jgi:hypothetical protein
LPDTQYPCTFLRFPYGRFRSTLGRELAVSIHCPFSASMVQTCRIKHAWHNSILHDVQIRSIILSHVSLSHFLIAVSGCTRRE